MKTEKKGGPRPNSGPKLKGSAHRVTRSFRLSPEAAAVLDQIPKGERSVWLESKIVKP